MKTRTLILLAVTAFALSPFSRAFGEAYIYTPQEANSPDGITVLSAQDTTTLTVQNTLNNATDMTWTGYHVDVSMAQPFTIANPFVSNPGWSAAITQQPTASGSGYTGMVDYVMGTGGASVPNGQLLSFSYQLVFTGGNASYMQNLSPVPEPTTFSLLAGGALLLGAFRLGRRQESRC